MMTIEALYQGFDLDEPSNPIAAAQPLREVQDCDRSQGDPGISQLIELMQQFNFKRSIALVYSLLLVDGPLSEKQLVVATRQSPKCVGHTLQQLLCLRLIGTDCQRGRRLYYATAPSLAWLSLIADLVWGISTPLGPIHSLPETDNPNVEHLRMICTEISSLAQRLFKPQAAALMHKERDAESPEELAQLICEILHHARRQVLAVSRSPRLSQVSSFWAVLTQRMEHGVHYHRVVDLEEVIDHGLKIVSRDMEVYGIDLRVMAPTRIGHKFYLVDHKFLAVFHQTEESLGIPRRGVGRITTHPQIVARYRNRFRRYSAEAIPGRFVVTHMRAVAHKLLQHARSKLLPIEVAWVESLIDYGKFSRFHPEAEWSKERLALAERRATAAGLVRRNSNGDIVPAYPVDVSTIEAAYASSTHRMQL